MNEQLPSNQERDPKRVLSALHSLHYVAAKSGRHVTLSASEVADVIEHIERLDRRVSELEMPWAQLAKKAMTDDGVEMQVFVTRLWKRCEDQQRELGKLNKERAPAPPSDALAQELLNDLRAAREYPSLRSYNLMQRAGDWIALRAGLSPTKPACLCGHPFAPNHQTPGTECSVEDCPCGRYRQADETPATLKPCADKYKCPNMKEVGGGMEGERYRCDCGQSYFLDYDEMR